MADANVSRGLEIPRANPGISWGWIISLVVAVLKPVMAVITPMIRTELEKLLLAFYAKAETTDNPWDDFLAELLLKLLGIPLPTGGGS